MNYKRIARSLTLIFFIAAFSPLYAQDSAPSKFEMKKDADNDGVKNKRINVLLPHQASSLMVRAAHLIQIKMVYLTT